MSRLGVEVVTDGRRIDKLLVSRERWRSLKTVGAAKQSMPPAIL